MCRGLVVITICLIGGMLLGGCADIQSPGLKKITTNPLDTTPDLKKGMTKDQVKGQWGEPNIVNKLSPGQFSAPREEWIYVGRTDMPIDWKYFSRNCYLIFESDALVDWGEKAEKQANTEVKKEIEQAQKLAKEGTEDLSTVK